MRAMPMVWRKAAARRRKSAQVEQRSAARPCSDAVVSDAGPTDLHFPLGEPVGR